MIKMKGITVMDDGFKKVKFSYNGTTHSITIVRDASVYEAINNFIKKEEKSKC